MRSACCGIERRSAGWLDPSWSAVALPAARFLLRATRDPAGVEDDVPHYARSLATTERPNDAITNATLSQTQPPSICSLGPPEFSVPSWNRSWAGGVWDLLPMGTGPGRHYVAQ